VDLLGRFARERRLDRGARASTIDTRAAAIRTWAGGLRLAFEAMAKLKAG
jgi:hypothetical protein